MTGVVCKQTAPPGTQRERGRGLLESHLIEREWVCMPTSLELNMASLSARLRVRDQCMATPSICVRVPTTFKAAKK